MWRVSCSFLTKSAKRFQALRKFCERKSPRPEYKYKRLELFEDDDDSGECHATAVLQARGCA
jgi:hypothetical protein